MSAGARNTTDASALARHVLIIDSHIDLPYRLVQDPEDVSERTERGDFDWPRARAGGIDVAFLSIYVPASYQRDGGARALADRQIDGVETLVDAAPDKFARVRDPADTASAAASGRVGLALGIENGAAIEADLAGLSYFRERGVRYVTLTHAENNAICDASYAEERLWNGLSPFGRDVVAEMNRLGLMIDVSHASDEAFHQVIELSRAPVIASHSSCRAFTPGWERNMSDAMIRSLAAHGGVIQINFGSSFISDRYRLQREAACDAIRRYVAAAGLADDSDLARAHARQYFVDHPIVPATLDDVADHIDHVVQLVGMEHVGLGSDFDGVGDSLPLGLKDVSAYPGLLGVLLERGYAAEEIERLASGNLLRVWTDVERVGTAALPVG